MAKQGKWSPVPIGQSPGRERGGCFIRRQPGATTAIYVSADAYEALGGLGYIRVLTDGPRVRIERCAQDSPHARRLSAIKQRGSFSCSVLDLPKGVHIRCEVIDGGLEGRLPARTSA